MGKYCGQCVLVDKENKRSYYDEYYCIEKKKYVSLSDSADRCRSFIYDPDCGKTKGGFKPSGLFYIVTMINNILGLGNDDEMMKVLYEAGNNLQKSNNSLKDIIFEEYNISGKLIADKINKSKDKHELAANIYIVYLMPIVEELKNGNEQKALIDYLKMVDELKESFEIEGMIELDYVYNTALLFPSDALCRTVNDTLNLEDTTNLEILSNFMDGCTDIELVDTYQNVSNEFVDVVYSIENEIVRENFVKKYLNTFIRAMAYNIKNFNADDLDDLKLYLKNFLFYLRSENESKLLHNDEDTSRNRLKISDR